MDKFDFRKSASLILGVALLLGSFIYVEFIRGRSAGVGGSPRPDGSRLKGPSPGGTAAIPAAAPEKEKSAAETERPKDPKARFLALLKKHRGSAWFSSRSVGVPFSPRRDLWEFFAKVKKELGDDCVPTLVALSETSESEFYQQFYLAILAGVKDPRAEGKLRALAGDRSLNPALRDLGVYGLGLLGTDSAWAAMKQIWAGIHEESPRFRSTAYAALGHFGNRGAEIIVKDALSQVSKGNIQSGAGLLWNVRGADQKVLEELIKENPSVHVRRGAIFSLSTELDSSRLSLFTDLITTSPDPETRKAALEQLSVALRFSYQSLGKFPENVAQLVANYAALPPELQIALHADLTIRDKLPLPLDRVLSNAGTLSPLARRNYVSALAADPKLHSQLAAFLGREGKSLQDTSQMSSDALRSIEHRADGFSSVELGKSLGALALDPQDYENGATWDLLAVGPASAKAAVVDQYSTLYHAHSGETERVTVLNNIKKLGAVATPALLEVARTESYPLAKMEAARAILSIPENQANLSVTEELRSVRAADWDQILEGRSTLGIQYAMTHPFGKEEGLIRFAGMVRDIYSVYGKPGQEPEIRSYADRMYIPEYIQKNDPRTAAWMRKTVRQILAQSIDEIRARESN